MATALPLPTAGRSRPVALHARVGAADWAVFLTEAAVRELSKVSRGKRCAINLDRAMERLKVKALRLRTYGGGEIWLDKHDLVPPLPVLLGDDGRPLARPRWFKIVEPYANDPL